MDYTSYLSASAKMVAESLFVDMDAMNERLHSECKHRIVAIVEGCKCECADCGALFPLAD